MPTSSTTPDTGPDLTGRLARVADRGLRWHGRTEQPDPDSIQRIVVLKPCCLGDMLMATPAVRALNQHAPNAGIAIVTDQWTRPAVETNPRIDRIISHPSPGGIRGAVQLAWQLRPFSFDVGISLDRSPMTALSLALARIPVRAGIDSHGRGIGLTHRVSPETETHETDLYLAVLKTLGIDSRSSVPEYHIPDETIASVNQMLPDRDEKRLVVIHPGGAVNPGVAMLEKRWPATNFGELAALLIREANAKVVLIGSESDQGAVETVRDFARAPVIDLCGQLSLPEVAALCQRASLFVGNDSGVTHLASAVGTPVVAIFGPTNPGRYRPLGRKVVVCAQEESWNAPDPGDLRSARRNALPDIAEVPLPKVLNGCLELLGGSA